jgi:hypothetical protein
VTAPDPTLGPASEEVRLRLLDQINRADRGPVSGCERSATSLATRRQSVDRAPGVGRVEAAR